MAMPIPQQLSSRLLLVLVALALAGEAAAAGAPTQAEWAPIQQQIEAVGINARDNLRDFLDGRTWAEGWTMLAALDRGAGDSAALAEHAAIAFDQAISEPLQQGNDKQVLVRARSAALLVHGLNEQGRLGEVPAVAERFGRNQDPEGLFHYRLAETAYRTAEWQAALKHLTAAKQEIEGRLAVPPAFRFLEARVYEAQAQVSAETGDNDKAIEALKSAAMTYERALQDDDLPVMRFNLGRMWRKLSKTETDKRTEYLEKARNNFRTAMLTNQTDPDYRIALGLVDLELENHREAWNGFNKVILDHDSGAVVVNKQDLLAVAYRGRGTAMLKQAEANPRAYSHADGLADLEQARALGDTSMDLDNNMLVAYLYMRSQARDAAEAEAWTARIDEIVTSGRPIETVNLAVASFRQADDVDREDLAAVATAVAEARNAVGLFATALGISIDDTTQWQSRGKREENATWRWLGHACQLQAELEQTLADANYSGVTLDVAAARDRAALAWAAAGDTGDTAARDHYLYYQAKRGPEYGYAAAIQALWWRTFLSADAWRTAIACYGASGAWRSPVHLGAWGGLLGVIFLLMVRAFFKKPAEPNPHPGLTRTRHRPERREPTPPAGTDSYEPTPTNLQTQPGIPDETAFKPKTAVDTPDGGRPLEPAKRRNKAVDDIASRLERELEQQEPDAQGGGKRRRRRR